MIVLGGLLLLFALMAFINSTQSGLFGLFFSLLTIGLGVLWLKSKKAVYHVSIASSSGEAHALSSVDRAYIDHVVHSINKAIVQYR